MGLLQISGMLSSKPVHACWFTYCYMLGAFFGAGHDLLHVLEY